MASDLGNRAVLFGRRPWWTHTRGRLLNGATVGWGGRFRILAGLVMLSVIDGAAVINTSFALGSWAGLVLENALGFFLVGSITKALSPPRRLFHPILLLPLVAGALLSWVAPGASGWIRWECVAGLGSIVVFWRLAGAPLSRRAFGAGITFASAVMIGVLLAMPGFDRANATGSTRACVTFVLLSAVSVLALGIHSLPCLLSAVKNLRPERVLHYVGLFLLGFWLSNSWKYPVFCLVAASLVVTLAWGSAVVLNDLVDVRIDALSNPERPLVTGAWEQGEYVWLGVVLTIISVVGACAVGSRFALCIVVNLALAALYSLPPFRLRRYLAIPAALIGLASLAITVAGFVCCGVRRFSEFPTALGWLILISVSLGASLKDVKDFEGDRSEGIRTLVTTLGLRRGQVVTGFLFGAALLLAPALLHKPILWLPSVIWAVLAFVSSTRRRFREQGLFLLYYAYIAVLIGLGALRPVE